ncbi:MAG: precorrin-2 C(20)-methyltransferase [Acidisphaera sp.]|nr:precorrin-2 C(20)-methyltransferase [Acidisphaera sp.]
MSTGGIMHVIGVGPGDPELMTLKAARLIAGARVIAYFAKRGKPGYARSIAAGHIAPGADELRFEFPFTTELPVHDACYQAGMEAFYADSAARIAARLDAGTDVALLCEGDPLLYGSPIALLGHGDLAWRSQVIPGVTGMSGCWSRAGCPMAQGDAVLTVLPGTLDERTLAARLGMGDAAVIIKLGRNLPKVRAALRRTGRFGDALYVEQGTMAGERILRLAELTVCAAPYFSLLLVPGQRT